MMLSHRAISAATTRSLDDYKCPRYRILTDDAIQLSPRAVFVVFNAPLRQRFSATLTESVYILDVERPDPVIGQSQLVGLFQNGTGNWVAPIGQLSSLVFGGGSAQPCSAEIEIVSRTA